MFDIHIEEFFSDSTKIMHQLYQSFPKKSMVFVEDISGPDQPDEYGVHSDRFLSCFGAMLWLADEGFLQFESTIRQEGIDQATLSAKGLHLMSSISYDDFLAELADDIQPSATHLKGKPNIDTLRHVLSHGTSSQLGLAMQHLLNKYAN